MLYHQTTGTGPVIIFIHGNSQSHRVWDAVIADTALAGYTCVAVDMPGHGQSFRSDDPGRDYSLRNMAQYLATFANQYSEQGYVLVGLSLATNYIAEKASSFINCKGVFLIGACIIGESLTPADIVQPNPNFASTFAASTTNAELNALMNDEAYHVSDELRERLKAMYHETDPKLRVRLGESVAQQEYDDEIGNLWAQNLPIAVVYGADDKLVIPDYMANLPLKMWKNKIIKIHRAGHCCQFDEPVLIAQMVAEFAGECFK